VGLLPKPELRGYLSRVKSVCGFRSVDASQTPTPDCGAPAVERALRGTSPEEVAAERRIAAEGVSRFSATVNGTYVQSCREKAAEEFIFADYIYPNEQRFHMRLNVTAGRRLV